MKRSALIVLTLCASLSLRAGDYEKAWEYIHKNDIPHARECLAKAMKAPATHDNALATLLLLETYEGYPEDVAQRLHNPVTTFSKPSPYWYAFWFSEAVLGDYGAKKGYQLDNLNQVLKDPAMDGSLRAAGEYFYGKHLYDLNEVAQTPAHFRAMGAVENWAHVGPFDNTSGSGFDKDYGPLHEPKAGKGFTIYNNTTADWFVPPIPTNEGWAFVGQYFPAVTGTGIGYSQSFVKAPAATDALLALGGAGAFKVWVNDRLLITHAEEARTELDQHVVPVHLNAGYNRVLVQTGFTRQSEAVNFIIRFINDRHDPIPGLENTAAVQPYTVDKQTAQPEEIPHFAVAFFKEALKKNPNDVTNAILLAKVYVRNEEYDKAKEVLHPCYRKYPDDPVVLNYYMTCLGESKDRTEAAEVRERIKAIDPGNYWVKIIESKRLADEKQYQEALDTLLVAEKMQGERLTTDIRKVGLLAGMQLIDSTVNTLRRAYERYPANNDIVGVMYKIEKQVYSDNDAALDVLRKYVALTNDYNGSYSLANEYLEQSKTDSALMVFRKMTTVEPYNKDSYENLINVFYKQRQYDSVMRYLELQHSISPYSHSVYGSMATCYLQQKNEAKAIENYEKALAIYPSQYEYRRRLRELQGKPNIFKYFPTLEYTKVIADAFKQPQDSTEPITVLFDQDNVVLYGKGATERINSFAAVLQNKAAIDNWKELSLPYNDAYQDLDIIKAEVVKRSGARIPGDVEGNQIVFEKLEPGDAIYYSYKVSSYGIGRLGREFWDSYLFGSTAPVVHQQYNVLVADGEELNYQVLNGPDLKPAISQQENFKLYSWTRDNMAVIHSQPFMPPLADVGVNLQVSTVKSWDVIAGWYSDLTRLQSRDDYDVSQAFGEIFPAGVANLADSVKARRIYEYIESNMAYSSVSFRQSAFVPQRASRTLATRLGDCKDLSTLFLAFARKAGLDANLVLVNTRDNGSHVMQLPSMEFNHCIIRVKFNDTDHYLELTNNMQAFDVLPNNVYGAQVLNIPYNFTPPAAIALLQPRRFAQSAAHVRSQVKVTGSDVEVVQDLCFTGARASLIRSVYTDRNEADRKDQVHYAVSNNFKNPVEVETFNFSNLGSLADSVHESVKFRVSNEVINVGDFSMLHPVFREQVATAGIFTNEARRYPFEYWDYENTDDYNDEVEIHLEQGKSFNQIPSGVDTTFKGMHYKLSYAQTSPGVLLVSRSFSTDSKAEIAEADFPGLKAFFQKIMSEEQKYISFK